MRFEELVSILCAKALAAKDDVEVRNILAELRQILHQHIEQLRTGLLVAYSPLATHPPSAAGVAPHSGVLQLERAVSTQDPEAKPARTWQRLVHEIACETDRGKALQLSEELNRLLGRRVETPGPC